MTPLVLLALAVSVPPSVQPMSRPTPTELSVPAAELDKARSLVSRLGNPLYSERERAYRDLWAMGRRALPILADAVIAAPDPEARTRCERLVAHAEHDDLNTRLNLFIADADGKFDHALPGWTEFRTNVGTDESARKLFAELYKAPANRALLTAIPRGKEHLAPRLADRAQELYNQIYQRFGAVNAVRVAPTLADVATVLLAECVTGGSDAVAGRMGGTQLIYQTSIRQDMTTGPLAPAVQKLVLRWLDTRDGPNGLMTAVNVITNLNLKEGVKYAEKLLKSEGLAPHTKAMAMMAIGKLGGKQHVTSLKPLLADETVLRALPNRGDTQVRDLALAMSAILSGEEPATFGLNMQSPGENMKFYYWNYHFPNADARTKGFKKWKELEPKLTKK